MADFTSKIDDFVTRILAKDQIANPNRYWVEFTFPNMGSLNNSNIRNNAPFALAFSNPGDVNNSFNSSGEMAMMCTTAVMPGRQLNVSEHKHENYAIGIPVSQNYTPVSFGFTLSQNLKERRFFELWQDVVVNISDGTMNFYSEYVADVKMYQLDKNNEITYGVRLVECYPTALSDVSYTYAANNETLNMSVTLSYKYWENIDTKSFYKSL